MGKSPDGHVERILGEAIADAHRAVAAYQRALRGGQGRRTVASAARAASLALGRVAAYASWPVSK